MIKRIIKAVCDEYEVTKEELFGLSRKRNIAEARQMAIYLTYRSTGLTVVEVGEIFSRNYTTVVYSVNKVGGMLEFDRLTRRHHAVIKSKLESK